MRLLSRDLAAQRGLPDVPISLSEKLKAGVGSFREMGLERAYAGSPRSATVAEGEQLLDRLATMVAVQVGEAMAISFIGEPPEVD